MTTTSIPGPHEQAASEWQPPGKANARDRRSAGVPPQAAGTIWFAGWLFTIGFANLIWWKAILGVVIWPYFLGITIR
jgi:hypothetical protein